MRWEEIDFRRNIWTIPSERMKAGIRHRVPLPVQAIAILESIRGLHDELVFPSPRKQTVLSDMVLTSFLRKTKAPSDTPGRVAVAHGFRSSFRDWCSEQGYPLTLLSEPWHILSKINLKRPTTGPICWNSAAL